MLTPGYLMKKNLDKPELRPELVAPIPEVVDTEQETQEEVLGIKLPESSPVGIEYLNDALFIGDSITTGIASVGKEVFGKGSTVVAVLGMSTHSATYDPFYTPPDNPYMQPMTAVEAVEYHHPRKVYIMLGTNGMDYGPMEWNVDGYDVLIDELKLRAPGTYIVIQSIPPVTAACARSRPAFSRDKIERYNNRLLELALEKGIYFLDLCEALSDEDGNLASKYAASDGMHMTYAGYQAWFDCIVGHAIRSGAEYVIGDDGHIDYFSGDDDSGDKQPEEIDLHGEWEYIGYEAPPAEPPEETGAATKKPTEKRKGYIYGLCEGGKGKGCDGQAGCRYYAALSVP